MNTRLKVLILTPAILWSAGSPAQRPETAYWSLEQAGEILEQTRTITLQPDLTSLTEGERAATDKLLQAGNILHEVYENSMHAEAAAALQALQAFQTGSEHQQALLDLYYLYEGPIATTLDNQRTAFVPVSDEQAGKNVYPPDMTVEQLDAFMQSRPELAEQMMAGRTVVRAHSGENLLRDLGMLQQYPVLDGLHPGLKAHLQSLLSSDDPAAWYAVPYSVRWAPEIIAISNLVYGASLDVKKDDPDLSAYLSLRSRDLLSENYEGGDAAWVRGQFRNLNAQIGSYETYADALYGVKAFYSLSLLVRDSKKSEELAAALGGLQAIQDTLPVGSGRKVQQDIPVNVYSIIADFGQSRGGNTASILPNNPDHARKYGRTILLRYNIMSNPEIFRNGQLKYQSAVVEEQASDLTLEGPFYRTLWHEVGHYLGVSTTADGRNLDEALAPWGNHFEEMKADLVSLYTSAHLNATGMMTDERLQSVQAAGILRVLQTNQPRPDQAYQTMQLMQMNYFLENGLLSFDESSGKLTIHYDSYQQVVSQMMGEVLAIQAAGEANKAAAFVARYSAWTPDLHARLATGLQAASEFRFLAIRYQALQ